MYKIFNNGKMMAIVIEGIIIVGIFSAYGIHKFIEGIINDEVKVEKEEKND